MFVSDQIVFIELQKTGSSHIGKLLSQLFEGQQIGLHNRPTADLFEKDQVFFGSIRDPWEWYVSLWAFGCQKKGGLYSRVNQSRNLRGIGVKQHPFLALHAFLIKTSKHREKWKNCYLDSNDASKFREWLYMIHDRKYWNDFGEGYGFSSIKNFSGLLTYRYMKLFCRNFDSVGFKKIRMYKDLKNFEEADCYINYFIQTENLTNNFIRTLELCGLEISNEQHKLITSTEKTNISSHKKNYAYYYDKAAINLVREREKFIIEKFNYIPPSERDGVI